MGIHYSKMKYGHTIQSYNNSIESNVPFIPMNEAVLKLSQLHLNHYAIRSLDWYTRIKMTRGSAASQNAANIKSKLSYFYEFDAVSNDIPDNNLFEKTKG